MQKLLHDMPKPYDTGRREFIRDLMLLSTALAAMPSCVGGNGDVGSGLKNLRLDSGQSEILRALADLVIPRTGTPGALDVKADAFALTMVEDCFRADQRDLFMKGLEAFDSAARRRLGARFNLSDIAGRMRFLQDLEKGDAGVEAKAFLKVYRTLLVRGYKESEHYLTRIRPYELVPGRYRGCVPLEREAT
jgi:hypothetical protein